MCGTDDRSEIGASKSTASGDTGTFDESDGSIRSHSDVPRRRFLQGVGATAGVSAVVGTGSSSVVAHTQCSAADQFVAADSSNYSAASRGANDIDWIVVHVTVGSYAGTINWFQNPDADVSAHYVVSNYEETDYPPGHVTQMVNHEDIAWHASSSNSPSIGIEHEWHPDYGEYITDACYEASASLAQCLADLYDVPLQYYYHVDSSSPPVCIYAEDGGILGHRDAPRDGSDCDLAHGDVKSCPGPDWNRDRYMDFVGCAGPTVSTDGVSDLTDEAATLEGTLHDIGPCADATYVYFLWREAGAGDWHHTTDPEKVYRPQSFEHRIDGLDSNTDYEFAAFAHNLADEFDVGGTRSFETYSECVLGVCV